MSNRFSIVIPLYNKARYVTKAVKSVLNQTIKEWELVIVDDGSTDDSATMIEQFDDERICLVRQVNMGVGIARNQGVIKSTANHLCFLDAPVRLCRKGDGKDYSFLVQTSDYGKHYVDEMVRVFQREGTDKFAKLCIWDNPYLKAASINPKLPLKYRLLHWYLRKTQGVSDKKMIKFFDKVLKSVC